MDEIDPDANYLLAPYEGADARAVVVPGSLLQHYMDFDLIQTTEDGFMLQPGVVSHECDDCRGSTVWEA